MDREQNGRAASEPPHREAGRDEEPWTHGPSGLAHVLMEHRTEPPRLVGSVAPAVVLKHMARAAARGVRGAYLAELVEDLGARLAFQRAGVRLYDVLLSTMSAAGALPASMTRARVEQLRGEEASHAALLGDVIRELGGDPSVITPAAEHQALLSMEIPELQESVRANSEVRLHPIMVAILVAEIADRDSWTVLITLARLLEQDAIAERFAEALARDVEHLRSVSEWMRLLAHAVA